MMGVNSKTQTKAVTPEKISKLAIKLLPEQSEIVTSKRKRKPVNYKYDIELKESKLNRL